MPAHRTARDLVIRLAVVAAIAPLAAPVHAQQAADAGLAVPVERMGLALDPSGVIGVEGGGVLPHLGWQGGAWLGWADDPLVVYERESGARRGSLVAGRLGGAAVAALGLGGRTQLGLELPFVLHQDRSLREVAVGPVAPLDRAVLGDLRLGAKARLLGGPAAGFELALLGGVTLPTSGGADWVGSTGVEGRLGLAASRAAGRWRGAAELSADLRRTREILNLDLGGELALAAGAAYALTSRPVELLSSLGLRTAADAPFADGNRTGLEWRGAVAWSRGGHRLLAGLGVGLAHGWGTPDWRVFLAATTGRAPPAAAVAPAPPPEPPAPAPEPPPPAAVEPPPPPPPPSPVAVEPPPPPPPPPPPDRDGDGVADPLDSCPDAPSDRPDGCPSGPTVTIEAERITIGETIQFDVGSDVIRPASFPLLDRVAAVIAAHPELGDVRVEGHTDDRGVRAKNLDLSRRRAAAVVRYLVGKGVAPARLASEGFGPDRPLTSERTPEAHARNRRVEFRIVPAAPAAPAQP